MEKPSLFRRIDLNIIVATIFLSLFGALMLYSSSGMDAGMMKKQLIFIALGVVLMVVLQFFEYRHLRKIATMGYGLSIVLILLLLVPWLAVSSHGATRWISLFGFTLQVSEAVKLLIIIFIADYISKHLLEMNKPKFVFQLWVIVGIVAGMILIFSSNLSSCLILLMITFCMTSISSGAKKMHYFTLLIAIVGVVCIYFYFKEHLPTQEELDQMDYHISRIVAWIAPENYNSDASFQVVQGLYAIGAGGLFGKGLGSSVQKAILPEASNDMILCVIAEELGIFGVVVLMLLYIYLFYQILLVAINAKDNFGRLFCSGVLFHFAFQTLVNMAVATNSIPNTGVTLPFISSGGSSMLLMFFQVGIVLAVRRREALREMKEN